MKALKRIAALAALASIPAAGEAACKIDKVAELPVTMTSGYKPMVSREDQRHGRASSSPTAAPSTA